MHPGGVQSHLIGEQSVSSTSDLMSQGRPFYSLTGTNPPLWLLLVCANDIVFLIVYLLFSYLFYLLHIVIYYFIVMAKEQRFRTRTIILYSTLSPNYSHTQFFASLLFFRLQLQVFRWSIENKQCIWHCNSISNNLQQWAVEWAIWVKSWPLMHTSLCCPDNVKTMAGNDANGDLEKQKHCMESHESLADNRSKWEQEQWNTAYWQQSQPQPDASVEKKKKKRIIGTFELLEPRLQPTWMFQSLVIQRWEAEL